MWFECFELMTILKKCAMDFDFMIETRQDG